MNTQKEFVVNMAAREGSEEVRRRTTETPSWAPGGADYDPSLPYGPKVYLARRKKPDPWWVTSIEIAVVIGVLLFFVYMYYYMDHLHFHVIRAYAYAGSSHAQHHLGHKYLRGRGTNKDESQAMYWFREAAKNKHPHGAYNLVAGHIQGYDTDVQEHEVEPLLQMAAENGVEEAKKALKDLYPHKYS
ncbi:uncharacterized protein LOC110244596 isoform X2 [Exaiptasia diaphana]|uniref:Uncharacterized protein n=1 Tax=Exaiptasia diaphana TaxID=2652724 RepID=A0A913XKX6_EXADI|nr:uncharacterized protein LOC110244596 isoform X2 [Exaiptasia diaphana]